MEVNHKKEREKRVRPEQIIDRSLSCHEDAGHNQVVPLTTR